MVLIVDVESEEDEQQNKKNRDKEKQKQDEESVIPSSMTAVTQVQVFIDHRSLRPVAHYNQPSLLCFYNHRAFVCTVEIEQYFLNHLVPMISLALPYHYCTV